MDAHLHPNWQRDIGPWLGWTSVQFIVTTHNPFVCQQGNPQLDLKPADARTDEKFSASKEGTGAIDLRRALVRSNRTIGVAHNRSAWLRK